MLKTGADRRIRILTVIAAVFFLVTGSTGLVFAADSIETANAPDVSSYHYHVFKTEGTYRYCCFTKDAKLTTIERARYEAKGTLEKEILDLTGTKFATYSEHAAAKDLSVTGISGLDKVKKAGLTAGYKVIPIELNLADSSGNTDRVKTTVILVYAHKVSTSSSGSAQGNSQQTGGSSAAGTADYDTDSTDNGTAGTNGTVSRKSAAATGSHVSRIEKKSSSEKNKTLAAGTADNNDNGSGGSGADPLGIGLVSAAALAALLFAVSIISDINVIRWFNQKKALRLKM